MVPAISRAKPLAILDSVNGAVAPRLLELAKGVDGELLQLLAPGVGAPRQQPSLEQVFVLTDSLVGQMSGFLIGEELLDGVLEKWNLDANNADFSRGPTANQIRGSLPGPEGESRLHDLATKTFRHPYNSCFRRH